MLAAGVPSRAIMEVLGHSGISVTMNTYAHVLPALRQDAADAIDERAGGVVSAAVWQQVWQQLRPLERPERAVDLGALGGTRTPNLLTDP